MALLKVGEAEGFVTETRRQAAVLPSLWADPECLFWRFRTLGTSIPAFLLYDAMASKTPPVTVPQEITILPQPLWPHSPRALFSTTAGGGKQAFVHWLARSNFTDGWHIEDDAVYTGDWGVLFHAYEHVDADLLAFTNTSNTANYW